MRSKSWLAYARMSDAGLVLVRASVANDLLDPTFGARGVRWLRSHGGLEEPFARVDDAVVNENRTRTPFSVLVKSGQPMLRRRLNAAYRRGDFPMLDQFQDDGLADYVAFAVPVGESVRSGEGGDGRVVDDRRFRRAHRGANRIARGIMPTLTLVFLLRTTHRTARTVIMTCLGIHAVERVMTTLPKTIRFVQSTPSSPTSI